MCNIAGYIGSKRAAPILIEMMKKQEGFMGGYYSGITTISNGQLYHCKVVGDVDRLTRETDASKLPGNIGLIHSRSKSGGGQAWAHPFVSDEGNLGYVANGDFGVFNTEESRTRNSKMVKELIGKGYTFATKLPGLDDYISLGDGNYVHMSEAKSHLITSLLKDGLQHDQAMAKAFEMTPSEIVGLLLHTKIPDKITVTRINMPMMVGRGWGETYLATTAMAFPHHIKDQFIFPLPPASTSEIYADEIRISKCRPNTGVIANIPTKLWCDLYTHLEQFLLENLGSPKSMPEIVEQAKQLFPIGEMCPIHHAIYETLRSFKDEQRLVLSQHTVPGAEEGITAPVFKMSIEKL